MTRYSMDPGAVSQERAALSDDPAELRACASAVCVTTAEAVAALSADASGLRLALDRFRQVHAHAFDALADATTALGNGVEASAAGERSVELLVTSSLAGLGRTLGH